jgi:hypothetical protein
VLIITSDLPHPPNLADAPLRQSKFSAVAGVDSTRERFSLQRYLDSIEKADKVEQAGIDPSAVQTALDKLKQHPEPEAGFMLVRQRCCVILAREEWMSVWSIRPW